MWLLVTKSMNLRIQGLDHLRSVGTQDWSKGMGETICSTETERQRVSSARGACGAISVLVSSLILWNQFLYSSSCDPKAGAYFYLTARDTGIRVDTYLRLDQSRLRCQATVNGVQSCAVQYGSPGAKRAVQATRLNIKGQWESFSRFVTTELANRSPSPTMWRKGNPLTPLVGMQTSTATMENSVEMS